MFRCKQDIVRNTEMLFLAVKQRKVEGTNDMVMANRDEIKAMNKDSEYKYFRVFECNTAKNKYVMNTRGGWEEC